MAAPTILYRVRQGEHNEALRYSLRTLVNVPHGEVCIVGAPPSWVRGVRLIEPGLWRSKWRALVGDLERACRLLSGRNVLLMDDDMFVLRRINGVPVMHEGSLLHHTQRKVGAYKRTLIATREYLEERGCVHPISYELHVPLPIDPDAMVAALAGALDTTLPVQARSIYGNEAGIGGRLSRDVKLNRGAPLPPTFLSTSPTTWPYWQSQLHRLFPRRSAFEA